MLAACALWIHGEPPLLLDFQAVHDFDHVVAVFRRNGRWGAISKTNGIGLRWRDPVYRNLRELAMSYLHEYYNKRDHKTLRTYSRPYDLRRMTPADWVTAEDGAWDLVDNLEATRHYKLMTPRAGAQPGAPRSLRARGRQPPAVPQAEKEVISAAGGPSRRGLGQVFLRLRFALERRDLVGIDADHQVVDVVVDLREPVCRCRPESPPRRRP